MMECSALLLTWMYERKSWCYQKKEQQNPAIEKRIPRVVGLHVLFSFFSSLKHPMMQNGEERLAQLFLLGVFVFLFCFSVNSFWRIQRRSRWRWSTGRLRVALFGESRGGGDSFEFVPVSLLAVWLMEKRQTPYVHEAPKKATRHWQCSPIEFALLPHRTKQLLL